MFSCMMDTMDVMHVQTFVCICLPLHVLSVLSSNASNALMCSFTWHVCLWMKADIHFSSTYFFIAVWCISAVTG